MLNFYSPCPVEPMVSGYVLGILRFEPSILNGVNSIVHAGDPPGYAAGGLYLTDYDVCIGIMDNTQDGDAMLIINDIIGIIQNHLNN